MLRFFPYVLKNLWRHRARTFLTVSGAAVALFVFSFVGSVQEGLDRRKAALVGRSLAQRRGLKPGQTFSIGEVTVTVAGVFAAEAPGEEQYIYCHLEFLQRTRGLNNIGVVTQLEVHLNDTADPDTVAR